MSLSKLLIIIVSLLFLLIFSINFILSVKNIKDYLEGEAMIHAQDTATSLGLSLSPYLGDENDPIIEAMVQAIFDRGYYREIKLVDVENTPLVDLVDDRDIQGVPKWFIGLLPMRMAQAKSDIHTGWQISANVTVVVNPGYAYSKLYQQVKSTFYYSAVVLAVSLVILQLAVGIALRSLKRLEHLALTIADGHFMTLDRTPWTTEFRNLATAMNSMSSKVATMIDKLQVKLESIGDKLSRDDLTGLYKKHVFLTDLKGLFQQDSEAYIYIIRLDSLSQLVNEQRNEKVDCFLIEMGTMLTGFCRPYPEGEATCYRFYGGEFALLMKQSDVSGVKAIAKRLSVELDHLGQKFGMEDVGHIGVVPFCSVSTSDMLMEAANEAYEQAKLIGRNSYFVRAEQRPARDLAEWKELVFDCVDQKRYELAFINQITSLEDGRWLMEEVFTRAYDAERESIAMATFISIAEKFTKIVELETDVTMKVLSAIEQSRMTHDLAVNLSARTVCSPEFRSWLSRELKQHSWATRNLVFSLTAYAAAKEENAYRSFIGFVHELGAKVIIKRLEPHSLSVSLCKSLKPDYIRLSREIGHNIAQDTEKQQFVSTLMDMSELLDITVFAEEVADDEDYTILKGMGISGASR